MKIGFSSPYLDTLGGGERYLLTLAAHWSKIHDVSVFWEGNSILDIAKKQLDIDLPRVKVVQNIFRGKNVFKKLVTTRRYDLLFFLSDGSIPSTVAAHNILHFQVPFRTIPYSAVKLSRYQAVVCNSKFTKASLDPRVGSRAVVIYPPVKPILKSGKKEKLILSVGRFSGFRTAKKQHVLIDAFARIAKQKKLTGWRLALVGGLLPSDEGYFNELKNLSGDLPVELVPNVSHSRLVDYYTRASIYWHAAGFGETDPRWMEHFGISTVEAMSAGAVPVVFSGGGQPEIVSDGENGFMWDTQEQLVKKTNRLMTDTSLFASLQKKAIERSRMFSVERFCDAFDRLLYEIAKT